MSPSPRKSDSKSRRCLMVLLLLATGLQEHGSQAYPGNSHEGDKPITRAHYPQPQQVAQNGCYGLVVGTTCRTNKPVGDLPDNAPEQVRSGRQTISQYCHLKSWYEWCQTHYFKAGQEVSRQKIGKNTTQVNYRNGLRGWIRYCDDGSRQSQSTEISPGMLAGGPHGEAFVYDKDIEPITCKQGGKKSMLVDYYEEQRKCLAEGRCKPNTQPLSPAGAQWQIRMNAFNECEARLNRAYGGNAPFRLRRDVCGGPPL